jgi:hypothetical protein
MAEIPTYDVWIKQTAAIGRPRSTFLLALDEAIKSRDEKAIKVALDRWIFDQKGQGKNWRDSVRNKTGAVANLYRAVNTLPRTPTKEDRAAMEFIAAEQAKALIKTFTNTRLVFKSDTLLAAVAGNRARLRDITANATRMEKLQTAGKTASTLKGHVQTGSDLIGGVTGGNGPVAAIKAKIVEAIRDICPSGVPDMDPDSVMKRIGLPGLEDFLKTAVPIIGAIRSGLKMAQAWADVAKSASDRYAASQARYVIAKGDPAAALKAIADLLNRELASNTAAAASATVTFGMQVAGMVGDMGAATGPAVAAVQAIAEIIQSIYEFVRDWKELNRANELLRLGAFNLQLFETCPLLGCYFLATQDHSTIIAFAITDYGTADWMTDVEAMVKLLGPVLDAARRLVKAAKFELMGVEVNDRTMAEKLHSLQQNKGLVDENYAVKTGVDKALAFPAHVKEVLTARFLAAVNRKPGAAAPP